MFTVDRLASDLFTTVSHKIYRSLAQEARQNAQRASRSEYFTSISSIQAGPRNTPQAFSTSTKMSITLNPSTISKITEKEKEITGSDDPVRGGPTAEAQKHVGEPFTGNLCNIAASEKNITGESSKRYDGPAASAQSLASGSSSASTTGTTNGDHTGKLDSQTISKITAAEKILSDQDQPVPGGPTARAQQHAGEPITPVALHDITEGEKKVTGGDRVKAGPTAVAQRELDKSRD